jgi:hypothetical protein
MRLRDSEYIKYQAEQTDEENRHYVSDDYAGYVFGSSARLERNEYGDLVGKDYSQYRYSSQKKKLCDRHCTEVDK